MPSNAGSVKTEAVTDYSICNLEGGLRLPGVSSERMRRKEVILLFNKLKIVGP